MLSRPRAADEHPLDVLVCVSEPTFPGWVVPVRAIGLLKIEDERGSEEHVVGVPGDDPAWAHVTDVDQLRARPRAEIGHFLVVHAGLQPRSRLDGARLGRPRRGSRGVR